jgi:hypothetical protein
MIVTGKVQRHLMEEVMKAEFGLMISLDGRPLAVGEIRPCSV